MKEILITATVLIVFVLLIRRLFRGKISSRLQYALWLLVALRLVIPISAQFDLGGLSGFRLMDLVEEDESGIAQQLDETIRLEEPIQMTMNSSSILFRLFATDEIRETVGNMSDDGPTSVFLAGTLGFSRLDVLWFLWGFGAVVVGAWILITNILFSRGLRKTRKLYELPEEVRANVLADKAPVIYLAEGISSPCLYGFPGREAVYLTADVTGDPDKLRHVVIHELVHKKHGDSFWALLRSVLVTVYWFHPLVWVAAACSKRDCELACDEGALVLLGEEERIPYGETLLSIITKKGRVSDLVCTATTMTGSGKSVKERIRFIAERPKTLLAAVAGVLLLTAVAGLFVFTKDARFHGTTVDAQEGLTVTGADMQIPLPASIGGISGCVVEKESDDVVIYHLAAQEEVGRFSKMPLKDALELVDEGREVVPISDYGHNYLLRAYCLGEPLMKTEHTYTPAGQGVLGHEDVYYIPEEVITEPADESRSVTEHTYTPSQSAAGEEDTHTGTPTESAGADEEERSSQAVTGVPGTDSNDDTTYMIEDKSSMNPMLSRDKELIPLEDEDKVDYLPNEQITSTVYQPTEVNADEVPSGCYIYVKADFYGKVKDNYQEEMAFIDGELKKTLDNVVILSLNRERREALFDALTANRTPYVGDNARVGALLDALPLPPTLNREGGFSLQTQKRPYSLRFDYEMSTDFITQEDRDMLYFNAAMLFYAVGNVEEIAMEVRNPSGESSMMVVYGLEELEKEFPILQNVDYEDDRMFREGLSEMFTAVETHLSETSAR